MKKLKFFFKLIHGVVLGLSSRAMTPHKTNVTKKTKLINPTKMFFDKELKCKVK